jgi:hypothetical protein
MVGLTILIGGVNTAHGNFAGLQTTGLHHWCRSP